MTAPLWNHLQYAQLPALEAAAADPETTKTPRSVTRQGVDGVAALSRSAPAIALLLDVVPPDVAPRGHGQDDDDERAAEDELAHGVVHVAGHRRGQGDDPQPHELPEALEQQDRDQPHGVAQAQQGQESHRGQEDVDDALEQRRGAVIADDERPLHDGQADAHQGVADPHRVQAPERQLWRVGTGGTAGSGKLVNGHGSSWKKTPGW